MYVSQLQVWGHRFCMWESRRIFSTHGSAQKSNTSGTNQCYSGSGCLTALYLGANQISRLIRRLLVIFLAPPIKTAPSGNLWDETFSILFSRVEVVFPTNSRTVLVIF